MKNTPYSLRCLYKFILDNTEKPLNKLEVSAYLFYLYLQFYKDNKVLLFPTYHFEFKLNTVICTMLYNTHNENDKLINYENLNIEYGYDFESHMALILKGMELVGGNRIIGSLSRLPSIDIRHRCKYKNRINRIVTENDVNNIINFIKKDLSIVKLTYR